ncbi:TIGR02302 family protein [Rhizobium sp. L1K21]|uniref:TIGR02302 family protein n=1 Tax=Rhizobium sp. L1K21 TaxID=2954933 RepID=UPI002093435D|nr:TIGR02302 family protein [Rhizobium sp. L1K21]MCO6188173.1 TIGR02302 family protein [Rhizobium sp. L1K21]
MADGQQESFAIIAALKRIARHRIVAKCVLFIEALLPRILWPASILLTFIALSWFGLFHLIPPLAGKIVLAAFVLAELYALKDLAKLRWPTDEAADRRLEMQNGLSHQAISTLSDKPAVDSPAALALWNAHQKRLADKINRLDAGTPEPGISKYDPYGLRVLPLLAVVIAFGYSYSNQGGRLFDAFNLRVENPDAAEMRADVWVTPPNYTGKAPIFLTSGEQASGPVLVPENSQVTIRLSGGGFREGETTFQTAKSDAPVPLVPEKDASVGQQVAQAPAAESRSYALKLTSDGRLDVNGQSWMFTVIKDNPPEITFDKEPARAANGALEIAFSAKDDYGVDSAHAIIEPADPADAEHALYDPPEYRLDLAKRNGSEVKGVTSRNLTEHPLSGKRVRVTLVASDSAGNEGRSRTKEIILPARNFREPLAAAAAEERQIFSLDTARLDWAIKLNEALFLRPEETIENLTHFLLMQSAGARMKLADNEERLKETADYLWEIALGIEDGNLSLAERNLRDAQERLADALQNNAGDEEIQKLMDELRQALNEYMQALAQQLQQNPDARMQQQNTQNILRQQDLERMLDQIQNLAQSGAREQAMNMLSEMQRMLNNLQTAGPRNNGSQQNSEMREQIDKLGELLQKQKSLMDETYGLEQALRDRMQRGDQPQSGDEQEQQNGGQRQEQQNGDQQQGAQDGSQQRDQMTAEELKEALKKLRAQQQALGEQLGQLQEGLRKQGIKPNPGFSDAGREMGKASDALGKGEGGRAVGSQGRAMEALRQGASELMEQLAQQGQGQGQGQAFSQPGRPGMDPLGRPLNSQGPEFGENVKLPEEADIQRAREILDTIRRKLGDNLSPEIERLYLERLLDIK